VRYDKFAGRSKDYECGLVWRKGFSYGLDRSTQAIFIKARTGNYENFDWLRRGSPKSLTSATNCRQVVASPIDRPFGGLFEVGLPPASHEPKRTAIEIRVEQFLAARMQRAKAVQNSPRVCEQPLLVAPYVEVKYQRPGQQPECAEAILKC
jgi:hypothetical protein